MKESLPFELSEKRIILSSRTKRVRILYPIWTLMAFYNLLVRRRSTKVYCLGLETAIAAWLASLFRRTDYIFDDADRLLLILKFPKIIERAIRWIEIRVSRASEMHIVPGKERYDYSSEAMVVVKNTPSESDLQKSTTEDIPAKPSSFVAYVNGWLGETRGLPPILRAAQELSGRPEISFIAAGRVDGDASRAFVKLPNVTYLGEVSPSKSLALYEISDVVITLYDPLIEINRYAESNKWGDAIATNTAIIVNSEVKTSKFLVEENAAVTFPYADAQQLAQLLVKLSQDPELLKQMSTGLTKLKSDLRPFDSVMSKLLSGWL